MFSKFCEKLNSPLKLKETKAEYLGNKQYQIIKRSTCDVLEKAISDIDACVVISWFSETNPDLLFGEESCLLKM